jgi:phosphate transport system protein
MDKLNLDQHISRQFNQDLEEIKTQMLEMGGRVERQLTNAVRALETADSRLADQVMVEEERIDELERTIDENCTTLIALRQPAATDLRMVMVVAKSIRDLERIGDEARKIAKMAIVLSVDGASPRGYVEVRHIANSVCEMLNDSLDAFMRFDSKAAIITMAKDMQIDRDYNSALRELITYMMEDPRSISRVINILWVLRALERIGDHAKNICEHVVYLVEGKDIRHGHLSDVE